VTTLSPVRPTITRLPADAVAVRDQGLLSRVARPCPEHRRDCGCVGRLNDEGCLVFWCEAGAHHFTAR
jgi:hypothetical protein